MAYAKTVKTQTMVPKDITEVHLMLSMEEAQTLLEVSRNIGGHPEHSRRRYMDNIYHELGRIPELLNRSNSDIFGEINFR